MIKLEKDHAFILTATFNTWWYDEFLVWNMTMINATDSTKDYSLVPLIVVPWDNVWTPDFAAVSISFLSFCFVLF